MNRTTKDFIQAFTILPLGPDTTVNDDIRDTRDDRPDVTGQPDLHRLRSSRASQTKLHLAP